LLSLLLAITPCSTGQVDELKLQYSTIRKYFPKTPLVILSGHRHVLYYEQVGALSSAAAVAAAKMLPLACALIVVLRRVVLT
jgi:hypothetical protein